MSRFVNRAWMVLILWTGLSLSAMAQTPQLRAFPTPEAAADTLTEAIRKKDDKAIVSILGMTWNDLVPGADYQDEEAREQFLKSWDRPTRSSRTGRTRYWSASGTRDGCRPSRSSGKGRNGASTSKPVVSRCRLA